jgi:hypothetical protein
LAILVGGWLIVGSSEIDGTWRNGSSSLTFSRDDYRLDACGARVGKFEIEEGFLIIRPNQFQTPGGCIGPSYDGVLDRFSGGEKRYTLEIADDHLVIAGTTWSSQAPPVR